MKKILEKLGNFVRGKKWEPCCNKVYSLIYSTHNSEPASGLNMPSDSWTCACKDVDVQRIHLTAL